MLGARARVRGRAGRASGRAPDDARVAARARCGRSSCAAPRSRSRPSCRRKHEQTSCASWSRRSARCTTSCATHYRDSLLGKIDKARPRQVEDPGARGAAAAAPGRLPPRPDRPGARGASQRQARRAAARASRRCGDEGHKALVFSQFTSFLALVRDRARRGQACRTSTSTAPRTTAQARVARFQDDADVPAVPDQPQGRRPRPEPDRRRLRLPARPVVEPRRRGPGHRPRPPHRPGQARLRLPPDRAATPSRRRSPPCRRPSATSPTRSSTPTAACCRSWTARRWKCCCRSRAAVASGPKLQK